MSAPPPSVDWAVEGPRLLEALRRLSDYASQEAMDHLLEENGRIIGWEKTLPFQAIIHEARAAIARATPGGETGT